MATQMHKVIQDIRSALPLQDGDGLTDGQMLECFVSCQETLALEALVRRHGPMVWGVCRRILPNHHDAEDAFQATFLVLVRKAASVNPREMVGNWLYGVARQTALKARGKAAKQRIRERQAGDMLDPVVKEQDLSGDVQKILDQELNRLPDKYRVAIVLCDLEGETRKEAARQLGLPVGTLAGRLTRGRAMLAKRLARHGLAVTCGTVATVLSQAAASASMPTSVLPATVTLVASVAVGKGAATGLVSAKVAALTEGVLKVMLLKKLKAMMMVLIVMLGMGAFGGGLYMHQASAPQVDNLDFGVHKLDFRDSKFDRKLVDYTIPNPEKYLTPEKEGLRVRLTGKNVPPARQAAGIFWRFDARGDFVATAKYEILNIERPKIGQGVGVAIYVHLKNPEKEGITIARRFQPAGEPFIVFNYMTTNEKGGTPPKVYKKFPTGDRSLRGVFRLAREGKVIIASFAEADGEFVELHRTDVSDADLDLIRFAGFGGGDTNAVLDIRILEFHFQGKDLVYYDRDTPPQDAVLPQPVLRPGGPPQDAVLPQPVVRPDRPKGQVVAPAEAPAPKPEKTKSNLLLLVISLCSLFSLVIVIGATVLFLRLRKSHVSDTTSRKSKKIVKSLDNQVASKKDAKPRPQS